MRSIPAFAMMLALAAPLAATPAQPPEPMLGRGIGLSEAIPGGPAIGVRPAGTLRPFGMRLDYGGARGGGNGLRVSTLADSAFGLPGAEPIRRVGQAIEGATAGKP